MRPLAGDRVARTPPDTPRPSTATAAATPGLPGLRLIATWHVRPVDRHEDRPRTPGPPHHQVLLTNQNLWP